MVIPSGQTYQSGIDELSVDILPPGVLPCRKADVIQNFPPAAAVTVQSPVGVVIEMAFCASRRDLIHESDIGLRIAVFSGDKYVVLESQIARSGADIHNQSGAVRPKYECVMVGLEVRQSGFGIEGNLVVVGVINDGACHCHVRDTAECYSYVVLMGIMPVDPNIAHFDSPDQRARFLVVVRFVSPQKNIGSRGYVQSVLRTVVTHIVYQAVV